MTRNLNEIERFFKGAPVTSIQPKQVGFKRLTEDAILPTKAHASDSGYDLTASEDVIVEPGETVVVKTGIAVELPAGYEATVRPRSGVTAKTKLRVQLGTIDNGYGGEIGVIVDNIATNVNVQRLFATSISGEDLDVGLAFDGETYLIQKNDRIAQLVITRLPEVTSVEITELGESDRGGNGFGSTGVTTEHTMKVAEAYSKAVVQNGEAFAKLAKDDSPATFPFTDAIKAYHDKQPKEDN